MQGKITSTGLISASVFVVVSKALVTRYLEDKEKGLASTAAYAAVLAVFAGLLVVPAAACPGLARSSVFRGRERPGRRVGHPGRPGRLHVDPGLGVRVSSQHGVVWVAQ
jgi:hypothetical protein